MLALLSHDRLRSATAAALSAHADCSLLYQTNRTWPTASANWTMVQESLARVWGTAPVIYNRGAAEAMCRTGGHGWTVELEMMVSGRSAVTGPLPPLPTEARGPMWKRRSARCVVGS